MPKPKKEHPITVLEQKGMLAILITLLDYTSFQPANMTTLRNKTGLHNQTIEAKVELLKQMNFIEDIKEKGIPGEHKVWLNERGRKLASILVQSTEFLPLK